MTFLKLTITILLLGSLAQNALASSSTPIHSKRAWDTDGLDSIFERDSKRWNLFEHLGNLSPYFNPPLPEGVSGRDLPEGCKVEQVFMMQRHGSRQPISQELPVIQNLSYYLSNHTSLFSHPKRPLPSEFSFLSKSPIWSSTLHLDDLSAPGRLELFSNGVRMRLDYPELGVRELFVGGQDRVIESARWFSDGFFGRNANASETVTIIPEDNKTISYITPMDTCGKWKYDFGNDLVLEWGSVYLSRIAHRLNALLRHSYPSIAFTPSHVHGMLWACAYETAVLGKENAGGLGSVWCGVFEEKEIEEFEYELDLLMRGSFGYGLPGEMGKVLGSLYISNLTSWLADGSLQMKLDFGHDTTIDMILSALGLAFDHSYPATGPPSPSRKWRTSNQVPFSAQMRWEKLTCSSSSHPTSNSSYLRLLLNEVPYPLTSICPKDGSGKGVKGVCEVEEFLASETVKKALEVEHGGKRWSEVCGDTL